MQPLKFHVPFSTIHSISISANCFVKKRLVNNHFELPSMVSFARTETGLAEIYHYDSDIRLRHWDVESFGTYRLAK
ncbi:hypothetical protein SETIT_7G103900v2 [Setaria italica]|uniref:Uncharacterized protein n=1 Tax=Setaria italica TaxID=4555 RepID=A0A368RVY2_SETIT|nr:hypothetical protein SETIT_7G103900v2 [Setaria italica]